MQNPPSRSASHNTNNDDEEEQQFDVPPLETAKEVIQELNTPEKVLNQKYVEAVLTSYVQEKWRRGGNKRKIEKKLSTLETQFARSIPWPHDFTRPFSNVCKAFGLHTPPGVAANIARGGPPLIPSGTPGSRGRGRSNAGEDEVAENTRREQERREIARAMEESQLDEAGRRSMALLQEQEDYELAEAMRLSMGMPTVEEVPRAEPVEETPQAGGAPESSAMGGWVESPPAAETTGKPLNPFFESDDVPKPTQEPIQPAKTGGVVMQSNNPFLSALDGR
ncbi:hypothetical protein IAT38_001340 [Cryptococcus sp. DSM 104549]